MKSTQNILAATLILAMAACTAQTKEKAESVSNETSIPKMKMTTDSPEGIATPNTLNSSVIGELNFFDGVPVPETAEKVYDYIDLHNAVDAYIKGIHIASMEGLKRGITKYGPANQTALLFENLMDSKAFWLTPNTLLFIWLLG